MIFRTFIFLSAASACLAQTTVNIRTLQGQMKYDTESFNVAPGAKVRLVLQNDDDMHHNMVICKPGKNIEQEVAQKAWTLGADGFAKQWIPEHPNLLFASKMADPQKSVTLEFTAPQQPGDYPYVCTLPGHAMVMNGVMIVGGSAGGLNELTFTLYEESWNKLPDFSQFKPAATDHVPSGLIDLSVAKKVNKPHGIVFDGHMDVPTDGTYTFEMASDDGSRLIINEKEVIKIDGTHPTQSKDGSVELTKGSHMLKLEYFEGGGQRDLSLSWSGPGFNDKPLSVGGSKKKEEAPSGFPLSPTKTEAVIYRNFIEGAGSRAIGVGYPGGVNLAYDADQMRIALVWQGAFIDAARHWNGRGQGFQPPLGYNVFSMPKGVPFASLESTSSEWPDTARKDSKMRPDNGYIFKGYRLDGAGRLPEFRCLLNGIAVTDLSIPKGSPATNNSAIERTLTLSGSDSTNKLHFRAATGKEIQKLADGRFSIDGKVFISLASGEGAQPILRDSGGQKELLIPVKFKDGKARIRQTISWN
jgi:uncharacterized cupredoxin-like copper-binding protein